MRKKFDVSNLAFVYLTWLGSRVVSVLDSGAEGPKRRRARAQKGPGSNSSRDAVLGKLFTHIVPLFTKQQNWQQPS